MTAPERVRPHAYHCCCGPVAEDPRCAALRSEVASAGAGELRSIADRLRGWAANIEIYGGDMYRWSNPAFVATTMRSIAERLEQLR